MTTNSRWILCHTCSSRDSLPHCWGKESSWTPRPACTYPPLDHSQTPLCRSQFWSSWLVAVLELLLRLSWGASGTKKINLRWKHIWSVAAVSCDCQPKAKWNFQSTCVQPLSRWLFQTYPYDTDANAKVSLRSSPLPLPQPLLLAPRLPPAGATRVCHGITPKNIDLEVWRFKRGSPGR